MRPDQDRVSGLIVSTIIKLCEKGLDFSNSVKIQGVIGVTVDERDTFFVHVNKNVSRSDCGLEFSPLPASRISSSNNIQEPSSSGHREGAVSVGSTGSSLSNNVTEGTHQNNYLSNVKIENNLGENGFQYQNSSFMNLQQSDSGGKPDVLFSSTSTCKAEATNIFEEGSSFNYNDEDTVEFKHVTEPTANEFLDIKPNIFSEKLHQSLTEMIDIPSEDEDTVQQLHRDRNFPHRSAAPERRLSIGVPRPRLPGVQRNLSRPAMASPQTDLPARMRNAGGQSRAQWNGSAMNPSASNKMELIPMQRQRFQAPFPQQSFQGRPRLVSQGQQIRAPRTKPPNQLRLVNPPRRMASSANVKGKSRGGDNVPNQVVECQSGEGFSFNKQLTVLSRYCCNLCGKVYKNQRSVLHHQSQVHGRPKVKRRKKTDAFVEEDARADGEDYYEDGYSEEAW